MIDHANDPEALQKATDDLMQASHKVAEFMYKQAQEQQNQQPKKQPSDQEPKEEGPVDAEINE